MRKASFLETTTFGIVRASARMAVMLAVNLAVSARFFFWSLLRLSVMEKRSSAASSGPARVFRLL